MQRVDRFHHNVARLRTSLPPLLCWCLALGSACTTAATTSHPTLPIVQQALAPTSQPAPQRIDPAQARRLELLLTHQSFLAAARIESEAIGSSGSRSEVWTSAQEFFQSVTLDELLEFTSHANPVVRAWCAKRFLQVAPQRIDAIATLLNDTEELMVLDGCIGRTMTVARYVVQSMGSNPTHLSILRSHAVSPIAGVRSGVATALAGDESRESQAVLRQLLQDPEPEVRASATRSYLATAAWELAPLENAANTDASGRVLEVLAGSDRPEVLSIIEAHVQTQGSMPMRLIETLTHAEVSPARTAFLLRRWHRSSDNYERNALLWYFTRLSDRAYRSIYREALQSDQPSTLASAATALLNLRDRASVPAFVRLLQNQNPEIRFVAARALLELDPQHGRPLVQNALNDVPPLIAQQLQELLDRTRSH